MKTTIKSILAIALCAVGLSAFAEEPDAVQLWKDGPYFATCNVGADTPEGYGILTNFNDAAQAVTEALGTEWRVPSDGELKMLAGDNDGDKVCSNVWTTCNGVAGRQFFGMTSGYEDKSIFLPAAGSNKGEGRVDAGNWGRYWTSKVYNDNEAYYLPFAHYNPPFVGSDTRSHGLSIRAVKDPPEPEISAESEAFAFDVREEIALAEGATTVAGVSYSDTAWGAADAADVTLGCTNVGSHVTGVLKSGLSGEDVTEVDLPKKDGGYRLTHSTGKLTSFVKFTVSGYPLGSEGNPWEIGANAAADVIAFSNGTGKVFFNPVRGTVTKAGLETITNAMGGASFTAKLIAADGSKTNDLVMVLGASGTAYKSIADALVANEASYTLFETDGYFVSYDGGWGSNGKMEIDTFIPTVPTNLTANAYTIVGYRFDGWSKDGTTVAYTNRHEGVDFAKPGETLVLTALWEHVGVEPEDYNALVAKLPQVTRPVTFDLVRDIEIPAGGKITVPSGKSVTFAGIGDFDVTGIVPKFGEPVTVGEGLAEGDLVRFDADGVSKPVFEEGNVVLHARGESADFPWVVDEAKGVTAWVDSALTNLAAVVIDNGMPMATNAIDLVALTNNLATYGYEPAKTPLNALLAVGKDGGAPEYVKPVGWVNALVDDGVCYTNLEAALAAGKTVVIPNFVTEEIPEEIVETGTGDDGETYTAVVENKPAEDVEEPVKATYAEGLLDLATSEKKNVTLEVTPTNVEDVAQSTVTSLTNVLLTALKDQEGHPMRIMETNIVDLSVYYNEAKQTALNSLIAIHIPWTIQPGITYGVSRMHGNPPVAQAIPEAEQPPDDLASGDECFVVDKTRNEIVLYVKNFSGYLVAGTMPLVPRIGGDIVWKASIGSGTVWAKLTLQVTNGQASAVSKVRYVFQDRPGATLWSAQKSARLTPAAELPKSEYPGLDQSVTWRYVEIPTSDAAYTGLVAGNRVTWGWSGDPTDNKVAWSEGKIELKKTNGVITAAEAGQYLGWVVWTAYDANYCAPVGRGAAALSAALSAAAAASPVANDAIHAPITITEANRAIAFGSAYLMDGSDPRCEIVEFGIDDGAVHGRIALKGADGTPVAPGDNARVIVYGSEDLGTEFEEYGAATRGEGGAFELATPADTKFFKVKIEVEGAVK